MSMFRTRVPERFKTEDFKVAATFRSDPRQPALKVLIENADSEIIQNVGERRIEGRGYCVRFSGSQFQTRNKPTVLALLESKHFRAPQNGFDIDHNDPTGFWRHFGLVNAKQVQTFEKVPAGEIDLSDLQKKIKSLNKTDMKELAEKSPEPLVDVR